ncbi:hypothetical protein [Acidihalobacter aeolianus]|uniref:hypothetical protein n=1 Tax=Acidihalobacter aeolianus TaxID=2792603 RepID=UPI0012EA3C70|nr:hypothetical protein [Acidihalobacter aeolianus]
MTPLDIAALIVGSAIIVVAKLMATGVTMIAISAQRTEQEMREKQEAVFANRG